MLTTPRTGSAARRWALCFVLTSWVPVAVAAAQAQDPEAPVAPEVITRDASRTRATIRAVRLAVPLRIDGQLDEAVYANARPAGDFIQTEPSEGQPATEKTDVWIFFDRDNLYVVGRCWDSQRQRDVVTEMRRDASVSVNESFSFSLDTFHDRRSGYNFETNPIGARWDGEVSEDGATINASPNPVWEMASGRFAQGWVIEARIPFKSLRYASGATQTWGLQVRRIVRWKNEISFLTLIPSAIGQRGHLKVSLNATLVGLEVPPASKNLEIKPYAISSLATDNTVRPGLSNDLHAAWGGDVKYGISKTLKADVSYNTDFAQVEADLQQINLSRFTLFFPEKRDFFLENAGAFGFGGATGTDNTPALFYSRRIGLSGSSAVPIEAGGRLSGRAGRFSIGLLTLQAKGVPAAGVRPTNFSVVRLKRDVFRRSSVGGMFTSRSVTERGVGSSQSFGVDGQFLLTDTLVANVFWARTRATDRPSAESMRMQLDYAGDRYGAHVEHLSVDANFNPEVGFVRHPDLHRTYGLFRFSPRPRRSNGTVRKFYYNGTFEYIENGAGRVESRVTTGEFAIDFQNSDKFNAKIANTYEYLPARLALAAGVAVPVGGYDYRNLLVGYNLGPGRGKGIANLALERGSFYSGTKTTFTVASPVFSLPPHVILEPIYSFNRVRLVQGSFRTHLLGPRFSYTVTPRMFLSALLQYNSTARRVSTNLRYRWEYHPGSELFVVLNEQRDTAVRGYPVLQNRAFVIKVNRLIRF